MRKLLFILMILFIVSNTNGQVLNKTKTGIQLAVNYYSKKDYEKATPLFKEYLNKRYNNYYFKLYISCLVELKQFENAEKEINKEIKKSRIPASELYVHWGYILIKQDNKAGAEEKFNLAVSLTPENKVHFQNTANTFTQWGEYEWAAKTYLLARKITGEKYHYELARSYLYLRKYDQMMEEYLDYIKIEEKYLPRVQSSIASTIRLDFNNELKGKYRKMVLKRIQSNPNKLVYNRLLIWILLQEKKFQSALRQLISLDRRTGNEDAGISNLANIALNNREYDEAQNAYKHLMSKGKDNPYFLNSYIQNLQISNLKFNNGGHTNQEEAIQLANKFKSGLEQIGYNQVSLSIIKKYAHLLAFYLHNTEEAIAVLNKGILITGLKAFEIGELKTELADIYIYADDPWEATLIYSQVIEANKNNTLGDNVKLKKARLSYYLGNFKWARAQLDVLKASTSKLTANDAFELALLIGKNSNLDTTDVPLQLFSQADLLFFRNEDSLAIATLDSIENNFPYHSLVDDILFRKAKIDLKNGNFIEAIGFLKQIIADFAYDVLADNALFLLADIYQYNLKDVIKAQELYNQMLINFPGSIYVVESRKRFRELRGDKIDEEKLEVTPADLFFNGINP